MSLISNDDNLRDKQITAIKRMLNLNSDEENTEKTWKVLVFDKHGQNVISSVLRVNDLHQCGVTVHMLLETERFSLPDVPAIYFVTPTKQNIDMISKDLDNGLYESVYLNFTSPLSRTLLEDLAQTAMTNNTSSLIGQVYDQYLNFVVTEPNIYSLGMTDVYKTLNNPGVTDQQIEAVIEQIVNGLFSVVLTSGSIPIIRCTRGNAAEAVATSLDKKLKNHVLNSRNEKSSTSNNNNNNNSNNSNRPVLIILDRNIDLVSMFAHSWTYQSLVNDACELNLNRIKVNVDGQLRNYDLEPTDFFWNGNSGLPFPEVADNLDEALKKYKQEAAELTGTTNIDNLDPQQMMDAAMGSQTRKLEAAVTQLPELTARKQTIDMHMNIATALLKAVGDRGLAEFFEAEENVSKQTKQQMMEMLQKEQFEPQDKMRLFIIYYILNDRITSAELKEYENVLSNAGCDMAALAYVKRNKELNKMAQLSYSSTSTVNNTTAAQNENLFSNLTGFTNRLTSGLNQNKIISEGFGNLVSGVKNLLPASKDLPITKIVESIMEPAVSSSSTQAQTDDYLYFDPKATRGAVSRPPKRNTYDEAIIFTVGGGNYNEYCNLQDWVVRNNGMKKVAYGSTELCSPQSFLNQCADLGRNI